jgi:hemolysin activation/secretion protein
MQDGVVTIEVLEGKLEGVRIDNASRLSTEAVQSRLSSVKAGDVFNKSSSERALLLPDTPGAVWWIRVLLRALSGEKVCW